MKRLLFLIYIYLFVFCFVSAQVYRTETSSDEIKTIQVNADGNWQQLPIINLNSDNYIRINFDRLGENSSKRLKYSIINCNADWTKSSLSEIEYLDGFNNAFIDDYAESVNTTIDYTNFNIEIPNNRQRIKLSGNYAVCVYEDNNPDNVLLTACFSVLDSQLLIEGFVSSNTDIDVNKQHQQVSFIIDYTNLPVRDTFSDLKVFVRQNNRSDNQASLLKPTYIRGNKLLYEHNKDLIFEAGNEYRRFESVSYRYNGLNMEYTEFQRPYYYANIRPDKIRAGRSYVYDQDQNGRFLIRNAESNYENADTDADYFITNFTLIAPEPFIEPIYLNGEFTNDIFDEKYLMKYDSEKKKYHTSVLLKQGMYNYQYLSKQGKIYSPSLIEGNYFETKNEYCVLVYHRPVGYRSDYLVGLLLITDN
jgi:hypothetical protein